MTMNSTKLLYVGSVIPSIGRRLRSMTDIKIKRILQLLFLLLQSLLYGMFLFLDITDTNLILSNRIKFVVIVLCFLYVLFYPRYESVVNNKFLLCLRAALFFTMISDLFLLVLDYYFYGVLTFIIVQQIYGIKLDLAKNKQTTDGLKRGMLQKFLRRFILLILLTIVICLTFKGLNVMIDPLLVITIFYFISIITNVLRAIRAVVKYPKNYSNRLFAIGMVLFLFCDINVGIFNSSGYLSLPEDLSYTLNSVSAVLMWAFYAPSQVLLSLSARLAAK